MQRYLKRYKASEFVSSPSKNLKAMKKISWFAFVMIWGSFTAQTLENTANLQPFWDKLNTRKSVSRVLFLGDSHIQSGYISQVLRRKFQQAYGNAGRGVVFPYQLANSNGSLDFVASSNQVWQTFRTVYEQDVFPQVGALGFVMGNNADSLIEMDFKDPEDAFDEVRIYNDASLNGEAFSVYETEKRLRDFVKIEKTLLNYTVQEGETYPELAAKFNVVTTRLAQLNGDKVKNPKAGMLIKAERATPVYNTNFEEGLRKIASHHFTGIETSFRYPKPTQHLLLRLNGSKGNILYGFQLLKSTAKSGVVFNTVGVNGATYADFMKYPLQLKQLKSTMPDLVMISLGTNEGISSITKEDFIKNVGNLISALREENKNLSILLISPTDNNLNPKKTAEVVDWISEASLKYNTAFLNMYKATGGRGYFTKALSQKKASADKVHFLQVGYEEQAMKIWRALEEYDDRYKVICVDTN